MISLHELKDIVLISLYFNIDICLVFQFWELFPALICANNISLVNNQFGDTLFNLFPSYLSSFENCVNDKIEFA